MLGDAQFILGPQVKELEQEIAKYLNIKHCIGVASGTDALILSLRALAIKTKGEEYFSPEDEIITTPFTFTATGGAILRAGATPVFVDIDPGTYSIRPDKIHQAISPRTIGIIPVHLYGQSCSMDTILDLAKDHKLFIVEDVAQAFGARYKGELLGNIGDAGAFSFFPSKNLGGFGDGGMISTNDDEIANLVQVLRKHGGKDKYNVEHIGYNSRLDTLQAAVLLVKLKHVNRLNELRRKVAAFYGQHLQDHPGLSLPTEIDGGHHVFHQYTLRIAAGKRDGYQNELQKRGIASAVYYPVPLHQMKVFNGKSRVFHPLIEAEKACQEVLSLPIEPLLTEEELQHVVKTVRDIHAKELGK